MGGWRLMPGLFVVAQTDPVDTSQTALSSPNATTWTTRTTSITFTATCVAFGAGLFVMGGEISDNPELISTSPDGVHWTARSSPADNNAVDQIIFGGGQFVAIYSTSGPFGPQSIMTSPDGITWTDHPIPDTSVHWADLCYSASLDLYCAISSTDPFVMTSPDGITWTEHATPAGNGMQSVIFGAGLFVALGGPSLQDQLITSPDGATWTLQPNIGGPTSSGAWTLIFQGGLFSALVGFDIDDPTQFSATSSDGITWTVVPLTLSGNWSRIAFGGGVYAAVGQDGTAGVITSTDGTTWVSQTTPATNSAVGICFGIVAGTATGNRWSGWSQGQGNHW